MKLAKLLTSLAALTMFIGVATVTGSASPGGGDNPIVVHAVQVQPGNPAEYRPTLVNLAFENTRKVAATQIVFQFYAAEAIVDRYYDTGTFAPGVTVNRSYIDFSTAADQRVKIIQVHFADGSSWNASDPGDATCESC
jgi:hypothetical protein